MTTPTTSTTNVAVVPASNNANVRKAFQILSELDQTVFSEICKLLTEDDSNSTIASNVVAAVLTSILKGLASPNAYLVANALSTYAGGLRGLALDFVRFHKCQFGRIGSLEAAPVTLVRVIHHCSDLLKKWAELKESTILNRIFHLFLDYYAPSSKSTTSTPGLDDTTKPVTVIPSDMESFQKLLSHTFDCICSNTHQTLEDVMDFDYLWASTLNDPNPRNDIALFCPDAETLKNVGEQQQSPSPIPSLKKKRKRASTGRDGDLSVTSESIRQVAKELAWAFSRTSYPFDSYTGDAIKKSSARKQRIINAASCVDLVAAAMMAPIISAPALKRRRFESGWIDPRRSVEDEAAAALSTMFNKHSFSTSGTSFSANLREKAKACLLQAVSDLLPTDPIQHKDIVVGAQRVASSVLPLVAPEKYVGFSKKSSPASNLLSFISSHQLRERNLRILKEGYHSAIAIKVNVTLSNTPLAISKDQKAIKLGWFMSRLQRSSFIDSVNEFYHLSSSERKLLSPLASSPLKGKLRVSIQQPEKDHCRAKSIIYTDQKHRTNNIILQEAQPIRHAVQLGRVDNPPTSESEIKDLNEWTTAIFCLVSTSSSIKPSPWLGNHFESLTTSIFDGSENQDQSCWNKTILPVIKYFLSIVVEGCSIDPGTCVVSDAGEYTVQEANATPGAVLQLYYFALESYIRSSHDTTLILNERFHSSLFSLCYWLIHKATSPTTTTTRIEDIGDSIAFHKLVESFIQVLKPGSESVTMNRALALPSYAIRILRQLQELLLGMIWMSSNDLRGNFACMVSELRKDSLKWHQICHIRDDYGGTAPEDTREQMVGYMLCKLVAVIKRRLETLCELLSASSAIAMANAAMKAFKTILHHRTDIFFHRHPDQLMLCSLYAVCARSKILPKLDFQNVADAYMEMNKDVLGSEIPYTILHRIHGCSGRSDQFGDIVALYNEVFVPIINKFFLSFRSSNYSTNGENRPVDGSMSHESRSEEKGERIDDTSDDEADLEKKTEISDVGKKPVVLTNELGNEGNEKIEEYKREASNVSIFSNDAETASAEKVTGVSNKEAEGATNDGAGGRIEMGDRGRNTCPGQHEREQKMDSSNGLKQVAVAQTLTDELGNEGNERTEEHNVNDNGEPEASNVQISSIEVEMASVEEGTCASMPDSEEATNDSGGRSMDTGGTGRSTCPGQQERCDLAQNEGSPHRMADDLILQEEKQLKGGEIQKVAVNDQKYDEATQVLPTAPSQTAGSSSQQHCGVNVEQPGKNGEELKVDILESYDLGGNNEVQTLAVEQTLSDELGNAGNETIKQYSVSDTSNAPISSNDVAR